MQSNQRARLVLNPVTLVALLLVGGVAAGIGFALLRRDPGPSTPSSSVATRGGTSFVVSTDHVDFGNMPWNRATTRQILVRNDGDHTVALRVEGADLITVEPRSLTLESGKIGRLLLTAQPRESGAWDDELRLLSDDVEPIVVRLQGTTRGATGSSTAAVAGESAGVPAAGAAIVDGSASGPGSGDAGEANAGGRSAAATGAGSAPGSVQIARSGGSSAAGGAPEGAAGGAVGAGAVGVMVPAGFATAPRSMAERSSVPTSDEPLDGEEPSPINPRNPEELEKTNDDEGEGEPPPGISAFVVSDASTVTLLGTANRFYPQQVTLLGSASGGAFSLGSSLQFPRVPLAFGESMDFGQRGSAVGSFDPTSGQVTLSMAVDAVDTRGRAAPMTIGLTSGTVTARNASGVLVSMTGQNRSTANGLVRLVGIAKIPEGYGNGAEQQLVLFDLVGTLQFATASGDPSSRGGGA